MFNYCTSDNCLSLSFLSQFFVKAYGMRMGPLRMWDLVGIDLFGRERERWGAGLGVSCSPLVGNDRRYQPTKRLVWLFTRAIPRKYH